MSIRKTIKVQDDLSDIIGKLYDLHTDYQNNVECIRNADSLPGMSEGSQALAKYRDALHKINKEVNVPQIEALSRKIRNVVEVVISTSIKSGDFDAVRAICAPMMEALPEGE